MTQRVISVYRLGSPALHNRQGERSCRNQPTGVKERAVRDCYQTGGLVVELRPEVEQSIALIILSLLYVFMFSMSSYHNIGCGMLDILSMRTVHGGAMTH